MRKFVSIVTVAVATSVCASSALAQTKTWTGATSNVWNTATNWSPSGVPTATDDVLIGPGAAAVTITGASAARSLDLRRNLEVTNSLSVHGGGISIQGGSTINVTSGDSLVFIGGTQAIVANANGGTIRFNPGFSSCSIFAQNSNLTIGANVTIEVATDGELFVNPIDFSGRSGTLNMQGTVVARFGSIQVNGPLSNFDSPTKTLSGGRWIIERGSIALRDNVLGNIDIDVIGANTFISYGDVLRSSTAITPLETININLGTIEIRNRDSRTFAPPGGTFQNSGTIRVAEGCRFGVTGNFRSLPGSVLDMTITGNDVNLQQPRVLISGVAQFNNTGTLRVPISNVVPFDCGTSFTLFEHTGRVGTIGTVQTIPSSTTVNAVYSNVPNTQIQVNGNCQLQSICDDIDFNNNSAFPEDQDVIDFFTVLAGGTCQ